MTEAEWMSCTDPEKMLAFLRGKASDRKLRLVAVGFCRQFPDESDHSLSRQAIELAELCADGLATEEERAISHRATYYFLDDVRWDDDRERTASVHAINCTVHHDAQFSAQSVASGWAVVDARCASLSKIIHCAVIRDLFGNPFQSVTIDPSSLSWNDGLVVRMAQGIYTDRAFGRMPILHDALLDAGCNDEALLLHCRNPEGHVRGCWAVDLILSKS